MCKSSVDFPLDCHSERTKKVTLLIIPRASLCYSAHSFSCQYPLAIDFLPRLLTCLNRAPSTSNNGFACDTRNQYVLHRLWGIWAVFFFFFSLCGDLWYVYPIHLPQRDWSLKMVTWRAKWLCCWVGKFEFILTIGNPFTMAINISMLWLPRIPWATS